MSKRLHEICVKKFSLHLLATSKLKYWIVVYVIQIYVTMRRILP